MKPVEVGVVRVEAVSEAPAVLTPQLLLAIFVHLNLTWIYYREWRAWRQYVFSQALLDDCLTPLAILNIFECAPYVKEVDVELLSPFDNI